MSPFRLGGTIFAKLIEEVEADQWIVSFQGELYQVKNETKISFAPGRNIQLKIVGVHPVRLKTVDSQSSNIHFNRRV